MTCILSSTVAGSLAPSVAISLSLTSVVTTVLLKRGVYGTANTVCKAVVPHISATVVFNLDLIRKYAVF